MKLVYKYLPVIGLLITIGFNSSCSKEDDCPTPTTVTDSLILNFNAYAAGELVEYRKVFKDPLNRDMRIELLKHYVSNIYLINGGKEILIKDVEFIVYEDNGEPDDDDLKQKIKLKVPVGIYTGIRMGIGLDAVQNDTDPASYPNDHPMSATMNTYWSTWDKYRFFMIEGRSDNDGDQILTDIFGYHTGFDVCYREKTFTKNIEIKQGSTTELNFSFEINEIFFGNDTLDVATEPTWHGDTATVSRATIISDNLMNTLHLE